MSRVLAVIIALGSAVVSAQPPDRSKTPQPGPAPTLTLPPMQAAQLANGLRVRLIEMHEVPIVKVALVVAAGASEDPAGKFGVASLTAAMLDEGAGSRSALEIAEEVAYLGATLGTSSSYDASTISAGVPVARLEPTLALMADVALRPRFPAAELERLRTEIPTGIPQAKHNPATPATRTAAHERKYSMFLRSSGKRPPSSVNSASAAP